MSNPTVNVNRWEANSQLEQDNKDLCKTMAIRFAKESLKWTEPVKFRWATLEENKNGVDCWISRDGKSAIGIDFKLRRTGTCKFWKNGNPDILIEYSQATTTGWATAGHNPNIVVMFIFLDAFEDNSKYASTAAIALTLSTCTRLVNEAPAHGFKVRKGYNGAGYAENYEVPLSVLESKSYRILAA